MKVVRLHGRGDLRLTDEPVPVPAAGEELVRVTAIGLCGSDRHWYVAGGIGDSTLAGAVVPGHEVAGVIVGGDRDGVRVVVDPADPCGHCAMCAVGLGHLCPDVRFAGHGETDGGMRELMTWPSARLHPVGAMIADGEAALLEPLGVALHALDLGDVRAAASAGVYGCGPIGLLLVQLLHMLGCSPIVATDRLPHRVEAASQLGATHVHVVDAGVIGANQTEPTVDVAFEAAGEDDALAAAVTQVRSGGRVVVVGIPVHDRTGFQASLVRRKELALLHCRRMTSGDLDRAVRLAESGQVELGALISQRFPLERSEEAFTNLVDRRGLKTIIEPASRSLT